MLTSGEHFWTSNQLSGPGLCPHHTLGRVQRDHFIVILGSSALRRVSVALWLPSPWPLAGSHRRQLLGSGHPPLTRGVISALQWWQVVRRHPSEVEACNLWLSTAHSMLALPSGHGNQHETNCALHHRTLGNTSCLPPPPFMSLWLQYEPWAGRQCLRGRHDEGSPSPVWVIPG